MVKKLLIAFLALLLVGCSSNAKPTVEKAFIFSTSNVLSNEDAQEAYDFFEKTLREGVKESARVESYSSEYQIPVFFVVNNKEKSFQFQLKYMIVVDDKHQITGRYLIDDDYYIDVFYPYISRLFDKYGPTFVQILNVEFVDTKIKITAKDWEKEFAAKETWGLFSVTELISLKYSAAEIYYGTYENARYILEIDDGNVKETVYFIDNYAIIKDRRIEIPAYIDIDSIFEEINWDYTQDEWSD
ncbi:MAG: hypothetical protein IJG59_04290 [Erysipelotrichaceae bacterium]|nr:hypothetical protein [Erysipelotrichaceae bacterium]